MNLFQAGALNKKNIIFGAGNGSLGFLKRISLPVAYFVDNDKNKHNKYFEEKLVFDPAILTEEKINEILIIVASIHYDEIRKQLIKMGFIEGEHFLESELFLNLILDNYYEEIIPKSTYAPWNEDKEFIWCHTLIKNNTLVDKYRCFELWSLVQQVSQLEGALLEVGVWRGGTGALIAKKAKICGIKNTVYLCDTFNGVVKAGKEDSVYVGGEHSDTNIQIVDSLLETMSLDNIKILTGIFPEETKGYVNEKAFRFCHIDVDVYESGKEVFNWVWSKLVLGGIVVYDDYGFSMCDGITKHVNELRHRDDLIFIHNLNGHAVLVKIK